MKIKADIQRSPIGLFYLGMFGLTPEGFDAASDIEIAGYASICALKLQGDYEPTLDQIRAGVLLAEAKAMEGQHPEVIEERRLRRLEFQERLEAIRREREL